MAWSCKCSQGEDQWRDLYGPPWWSCANKYHYTQLCEEQFTPSRADDWPSWGMCHLCRSGKCLHLTLRLCHHLGSSGRSPGLQWGPDSPGSPRLVKFCSMGSYYPRNPHYKPCSECYEGEGDRCPGDAVGKCLGGPSPVGAKGYSHSGGQPNCGKVQPKWIRWQVSHH